jgi:hypothetical protein
MEHAYEELTGALKTQRSSRKDLRGLKIQHRRPPRSWPSRRQKRSRSDDEAERLSPSARRGQAAPRSPPRQAKRPNISKAPSTPVPGHYGPIAAVNAPRSRQQPAKRPRSVSPPVNMADPSAPSPPRAPTPVKHKAKKARNGSDQTEQASRQAKPKAPVSLLLFRFQARRGPVGVSAGW